MYHVVPVFTNSFSILDIIACLLYKLYASTNV
jgi:hypothetical protein